MKAIFSFFYVFLITNIYSQFGTIDTTFGTNGYADHNFLPSVFVTGYDTLEQSDSKIITMGGGNVNGTVIKRFLSNGSIDTSFNNSGTLIISTYYSSANNMILQPDGKLLVLAYNDASSKQSIYRINIDGTLDATFGTNGLVSYGQYMIYGIECFAILPNNKIIITYTGGNGNLICMSRLNSDGTLDSTFGINGTITNNFSTAKVLKKIVVQQDGKFIAITYEFNSYRLRRYNIDGTIDTNYINNNFNFNVYDMPSIYIQPDGKCVVLASCGYCTEKLYRFNTNGSFDTTFGTNGRVNYSFTTDFVNAISLVIQSDNKIVLNSQVKIGTEYSYALRRFNENGSNDNSFGTNGLVLVRNSDQYTAYGGTLLFLQSGKLLHSVMYKYGSTNPANPEDYFYGMERYNTGLGLRTDTYAISEILVYPNPSNGLFNLDLTNEVEVFDNVSVFNLLGQNILNQSVDAKTINEINLSNFSDGIYFVKLQNDNKSLEFKLIKQK